jgi:phospholipid/cholesterol/gamma-HCH transport system permease protein
MQVPPRTVGAMAVASSIPAGTDAVAAPPSAVLADEGAGLVLRLAGDWVIAHGAPGLAFVRARLAAASGVSRLRFDAALLGAWDSVLPSYLVQVRELAGAHGIAVDDGDLPEGAVRLVGLAVAVPAHRENRARADPSAVERLGVAVIGALAAAADVTSFVGEAAAAIGRLLRGRALMRGRDFWLAVQQAGAGALPIIGVISFLVGMIQAFVGGSQLALFGAQIFVANLVAIAMLREMGPLMAALIMAGRTGSAYAAELGTMQVNEEVDALRGLGISPVEFLVLPRLLALALMMPLLAIYANLFGVLGGAVVGVGILQISPVTYWEQSLQFLRPQDMLVGLAKAGVFGILVGAAGCLRGIRSGKDAASVGASTTSAVVSGIVVVIVADFMINVVCFALGV